MLHSQATESLRNQLVSRAVEGRINNLQVIRHALDHVRVDRLLHDLSKKGFVRFAAQKFNKPLRHGLLKGHGRHIAEHVLFPHTGGDGLGMLRRELRSVRPIDLIPIVLLWIMAGRNVQPGGGAVMDHGEGKLRRGPQLVKNPHMNAVGRHDRGSLPGKALAVLAAVITDHNTLFAGRRPLRPDHIGKSLGSPAHHMDIHAAQSNTHFAAKAGSSEFKGSKKAAFYLRFISPDG